MDSLISLNDVTKRYDSGGQPAVDRIRLEVRWRTPADVRIH
jgi:hypothetical protein